VTVSGPIFTGRERHIREGSNLSNIPQWLADITVGQIFIVLVGIGAIVAGWRFVSPLALGLKNFFEDWNGEPARPKSGIPERPGVMATLKDHGDEIVKNSQKLEAIESQVTPNHGSELKLAEELQGLRREVAELTTGVKETQADVSSLALGMKETQGALNDHLENVPVILADLLERANENTAEMIANSRVGHLQPSLFEDAR